MKLIHFSSHSNLKTVNPKFFGKALATKNDLQGERKSFFFVKGSTFGQDKQLLQGKTRYEADSKGLKLYDATKDKQGIYGLLNRCKVDELISAKHDGFIIHRYDGAKVVCLYKSIKVKKVEKKN